MAFIAGVRAERATCATPAAAPDATEDGANPETENTGRARNSHGAGSPCGTAAECAHFGAGIAARACTAASFGFDIVGAVARFPTSARRCHFSTGVASARLAPHPGAAPATGAGTFLPAGTRA